MKAVSRDIVRWLPYLRRHAHALTGSRERGDSYVMACLTAVVTEPERLSSAGNVRLALFKLFHTIWHMIDEEYPAVDADPAVDELALCRGLAELPPLGRQVLLLTTMEGFSLRDTAHIVGVSEEVVYETLAQAREQIRGRFEYLIPLDFYRQAMRRRPVQRPAAHRRAPLAEGKKARSGHGMSAGRPASETGRLFPST